MNTKKTEEELIDIAKQFINGEIKEIGKTIGYGGFGLVVEAITKTKTYVGKLIKKEKHDETDLIYDIKGPNIINIIKVYTKPVKIGKDADEHDEEYHFILMEKALLKDLKTMNNQTYKNKTFKLINKAPFERVASDNLIRYYCYQIIKGFETLDRSGFSHFDIKPENILITTSLNLKLSDFGLLRNPNDIKTKDGRIIIPGGTTGYFSPEYYVNPIVPIDVAKKQDYFALGATIYNLKYGEPMLGELNYMQFKDGEMTSDYIIDLLQRAMDNIKSKKLSDQDFIDFLCSLIKYKPDDRPIFEEIYRNKWLNKNLDKIMKIYNNNYLDEVKFFMELNKSDFLIQKKDELKKTRKKFTFNKKFEVLI
jgi:serine/threonine protein kinase